MMRSRENENKEFVTIKLIRTFTTVATIFTFLLPLLQKHICDKKYLLNNSLIYKTMFWKSLKQSSLFLRSF